MKLSKIVVLLVPILCFLSSCSKENNSGPPAAAPNTWGFSESGNSFKGSIDSTMISSRGNYNGLVITGIAADGVSVITLGVMGIDSVNSRSYTGSQVGFIYTRGHELLYENDNSSNNFTITINKIGPGQISGSFSGTLIDGSGNQKKISNGVFTANR